ncbi:MAG TPA: hypothetical protein VJP76_06635 [Candidatus Tumulicola sp.]|nr:hypothetical protein [Candidatus Tumulicola sp.]
MTTVLEADAFHKHWWTRTDFRHIRVKFTIDWSQPIDGLLVVEFLLPVDALDNFSNTAGDWNPAYDTVVDGIDYFVWTEYVNCTSPQSDAPQSHDIASTLAVNVKPYANPLALLWHVCVGEEMAADWNRKQIDLKPYAPSI